MNLTGRSLFLLAALLLTGPGLAEDKDPPTPPQVFRTFMPEAGPSAFAVVLAPDLALCYDSLRGGVNQSWRGTLDLAPTFQAKINQSAKIAGTVFYEESIVQPLRINDPDKVPERRFKGYRYADGGVIFDYTLDGVAVSETLRAIAMAGGGGVERLWTVEGGEHTLYFLAQKQADAEVVFTGGEQISPDLWKFETGTKTASPFAMTMQPKTEKTEK